MCTVSMVGDHYNDIFKRRPWYPQSPQQWHIPVETITREEFDELKRQVAEMKTLLIRAKEYDERNNEPDCEIEEKMDVLRKVAKLVGIDLDDVIGKGDSDAAQTA